METIEGPIRDAIREAHDTAPLGSELRTRLSGALGTLAELSSSMARSARGRWADEEPTYYDLDGDHWEEGWWGNRGDARWYSDAWEDEYADGDCRGYYEQGPADMDTRDVGVPPWIASAAAVGGDGACSARVPKRWRKDAEDANGVQGRHASVDEVPQDHEQAARLQAAVNDAARAAAVVPAPPTPNIEEMALERKRQEVWDLAQDQGAEITCEAIAQMSTERF